MLYRLHTSMNDFHHNFSENMLFGFYKEQT